MMDIFVDIVDQEKQHDNYINTKRDPYSVKLINSWVDEKFVCRDGNRKFIKEFQAEFNSSFWELYCYQVLKELGCVFNFETAYPDFVVQLNSETILVECVIANNAKDKPQESNVNTKFNDHSNADEKVHSQVIRLANAVQGKKDKLLKQYHKNADNIDRPYIIAAAPFDQSFFMDTGTESIIALLYGWVMNRTTGEEFQGDAAIKDESVEIPIGIFLLDEYRDVSGVLFSNLASIGKVQAMGRNPNLTFQHLRYNLVEDKPVMRVDSRLKYDGLDSRCIFIRDFYKNLFTDSVNMNMRKPLLKWNTNYKERITDGLYYFVNPLAKYRISDKTLDEMYVAGINIIEYDLYTSRLIFDRLHDDSLISRFVLSLKRSLD